MSANQLLAAALDLAARGLPVFPLHDPTSGRCSCGRADCGSPGKHPRTPHGVKDASTDPERVRAWWKSWPTANIGVSTEHLLVLDRDDRHGGVETLARHVAEHGSLPETPEVRTGGGGHFYFAAPRGGVRCSAGALGAGLDVRGVGGYVVAPPSLHSSGECYAWVVTHDECDLAPAPAWLLALIDRPRARKLSNGATREPGSDDDAISEGRRHDDLLRMAGAMRRVGAEEREILAALRAANETRCKPPLDESEVAALARDVARRYKPDAVEPPAAPRRYVPFPVETLPGACRALVECGSAAMGVDPAYFAVPLLGALAGAIGNARRLRIKRAYTEPAILWPSVVSPSGAMKTPPLDLILRPHRTADHKAMEATRLAHERYEREFLAFEKARAVYRSTKGAAEPPERPARPSRLAFLVDDVTSEALIERLADNPRGLLLGLDELAGWIRGMDAYRSGRGGDMQRYLAMHRAGPVKVDRKTGDRPTLYVPRAALSVVGTIQPRTLARVIDDEALAAGLGARLFLARPPARAPRWSEVDVPDYVLARYCATVEALLALELDGAGEPIELTLSREARTVWIAHHDAIAERQDDEADEDLRAAFSKLRGGALRLALVLGLARAAEEGRAAELRELSEEDMQAGSAVANWFAGEAERIYAELRGGSDAGDGLTREQRRLLDWIERRDEVTARTAAQSLHRFREGGTAAAEKALAELVALGALVRVPGPRTATYRPAPRGPANTANANTSGPDDPAAVGSVGVGAVGGLTEGAGDPPPDRSDGAGAGDEWGDL